jgi:O-antigen/teichoic acid export membrane protein
MKHNLNIKKQLIKSFLGVGVMKLLSMPIGLVTSIIIARALGPENFGKYAFIMALIPLIALPVSGGFPQLLTREVASFAHANEWALYKGALKASHGWVFIVSTAVLGFYWTFGVGLGLIPTEGKWGLLPVAIFIIPLMGLGAVRTGTIKGLGLPAYAELPGQLIQPIFILLFYASTAWFHVLDARVAIWGQIAGAGLVFLIASWMFYRIQPQSASRPKPEYRIQHWGAALLPFSLLAMVSTFNAQIGIIALGILGTDEQVAAMRIAERGGQFVVLSLMLVNQVIAPYIVRAYRDGDINRLQKLAQKSSRGSFFIALPIAMILILGGENFIGLIFGIEYAQISYYPIVIIVIGQLVNVFFGSVGHFLSMSGHERDTLRGQFFSVLANLFFCIILIPKFGAIGAATAVSISIFIWNIILEYFVISRIKIRTTII